VRQSLARLLRISRRMPLRRYSIQGLPGYLQPWSDGLPHEPQEPFDNEPRKLHDSLHLCILPGPVSQRNMGHHRCHHERPHHEDEIEFLDKKTPFWRTNEGSVIRVALDDHRAVLGLANPVEKASDMLKDEKMLPPHPALFRDPELRARTQGRNGARPESR
jgi:hypothetical protein